MSLALPPLATHFQAAIARTKLGKPAQQGYLSGIGGLLLMAQLWDAAVGDLYGIDTPEGVLLAEVVRVDATGAFLLPFGDAQGLKIGQVLRKKESMQDFIVDASFLGRAVDAFGRALDGRPLPLATHRVPLYRPPAALAQRQAVAEQMYTGMRVFDTLLPLGYGQRMGIFAPAGVGKTTLLTALCRNCAADVVVIGLIGERNREAAHMLATHQQELSDRAILVIATSDTAAPERVRAAYATHALAEYFCHQQGMRVLLVLDSLTRLAMAQREIGLAIGEPPTNKGYPPSTFALLPKLVERAGNFTHGGSITAVYSILMEADIVDPVADSLRGLLDGHTMLTRTLAERQHYPAVDVVQSLSRLESVLLKNPVSQHAKQLRKWLAVLEDNKELLSIGAYQAGSLPDLDIALAKRRDIDAFLQQDAHSAIDFAAMSTHLELLLR